MDKQKIAELEAAEKAAWEEVNEAQHRWFPYKKLLDAAKDQARIDLEKEAMRQEILKELKGTQA